MLKYIAIGITVVLILTVFWEENRINIMSSEIINLKDALHNNPFKYDPYENKIGFDVFLEPRFLKTNDSVYEIHRIFFGFSPELYIVKVECLIDSSYNLIFKKGSVCNPVTKYGICNLEKQTTNKLSKATWTEFKNKLKKPDIYDLTLWMKNMSSIGPVLEWEAVIGYKTYRFSDYTGFHDQFSEACGFLLKQVPDKELHQMLKKYPMN
mgnify:FL=1